MELGSYVPILKCKQGELNALSGLKPATKAKLTPFLELPPLAWDYSKDEPSESSDELVKTLTTKIEMKLGTRSIIVDGSNLPNDSRTEEGLHPFAKFLELALGKGLQVTPVVGISSPEDYVDAVVSIRPKEICLRVTKLESAKPKSLQTRITEILNKVNIGKEAVILLLDMGDVAEHTVELLAYESRIALNMLPFSNEWGELILASGAFPNNLGSVPVGESLLPRTDWQAWKNLLAEGEIPRAPLFSDYGVSNPRWFDMDPRFMHVSANIRYTTTEDWFILRGRSLRIDGHEQLYDLAGRLTRSAYYKGRNFSDGDKVIEDCASRVTGPGNATTWRQAGTSHHIEFVISQLSN